MEFKFKNDDIVKIRSINFSNSGLTQILPDEYRITDCRNTLGYNQYRLKSMIGWWHEATLVKAEEV